MGKGISFYPDKKALSKAQSEIDKARKARDRALRNGTSDEIEAAQEELKKAYANENEIIRQAEEDARRN